MTLRISNGWQHVARTRGDDATPRRGDGIAALRNNCTPLQGLGGQAGLASLPYRCMATDTDTCKDFVEFILFNIYIRLAGALGISFCIFSFSSFLLFVSNLHIAVDILTAHPDMRRRVCLCLARCPDNRWQILLPSLHHLIYLCLASKWTTLHTTSIAWPKNNCLLLPSVHLHRCIALAT